MISSPVVRHRDIILAYSELHALRTGSSQLARDDNLTTLGTALHDESQDTVACSSYSEAIEEFVSEGFALSDGRKTTVLDLGGVEGDTVLGEFESLLDQRGEFTDATSLFAQDFLGVCGSDDCDGGMLE